MDDLVRSAQISRLTHEEHPGQALSALLNETVFGWLSICVIFLGEPVSDLAVWFYSADGKEQRGDKPTPPKQRYHEPHDPNRHPAGWTDAQGCFHLSYPVPVGTYRCKIQGQHETTITTVEYAEDPFVLALPIGRSYFDIYGRLLTGSALPE